MTGCPGLARVTLQVLDGTGEQVPAGAVGHRRPGAPAAGDARAAGACWRPPPAHHYRDAGGWGPDIPYHHSAALYLVREAGLFLAFCTKLLPMAFLAGFAWEAYLCCSDDIKLCPSAGAADDLC
jgi:hypothetical protein